MKATVEGSRKNNANDTKLISLNLIRPNLLNCYQGDENAGEIFNCLRGIWPGVSLMDTGELFFSFRFRKKLKGLNGF